jgi:hypothetical protein
MNAMLKQSARFGLALSLILLFASNALCQNQVIRIKKPLKAQILSGRVHRGDSSDGVQGVLVEDCTKGWKVVKASTHTDEKGDFDFPNASPTEKHYLRLSLTGARTLLVKVKIVPAGPKELWLSLALIT